MRRILPDPADPVDIYTEYTVPDTALSKVGWHLRMNFVSSADGAVTEQGRSRGLSTPGDHRLFAALRDLADVVLVGAGTARIEGYGPDRPGQTRRDLRRRAGRSEAPAIAVVSSRLDLDPDSELFTAPDARTVVLTHGRAPADRRAELERVVEVVTVGAEAVDPAEALGALADRGLRRVLCEGGPLLFGALLAAGVVNELCLTLSPLLAGPGSGRIVAGPELTAPVPLTLSGLLEEEGALFCRYTT
ncbi:MAG TPA: pyrimidine reductase family protein [Mycobacteriales bacterium]|jgi:Pyrimidine reductase, riboflavin biosynthesis